MHRPFLRLVLCVTVGACSRAPAPQEAPAPVMPPASPAPEASLPVSAAPSSTVVREYRGAYTRGFEASWFAPCDAPMDDALWWVTLTDDALHQRDSLLKTMTRPPTTALAVRWRGTTSPRMQAGQMGRGTRYLLVTEILEVRPLPSEGACMPVARTS